MAILGDDSPRKLTADLPRKLPTSFPLSSGTGARYMFVYVHGVSPSYQLDSSGFFFCKQVNSPFPWPTKEVAMALLKPGSEHLHLVGFPSWPWLMTLEGINQYSIHIPFIFSYSIHIPLFIFHHITTM